MQDPASAQPTPIFRRIFLSPADSRLRAGWRLLLHTLLYFLVAIVLVLSYLAAGLPFEGSSLELQPAPAFLDLATILIATWIARRFLDRKSFHSLGLSMTHRARTDLIVGFLIPGLLMGMVYIVEIVAGWTSFEQWAWQSAPVNEVITGTLSGLLVFIFVGFGEEILSRGYHLQNLREGLNLGWALVISSGVFAVLHASNPNSSIISTFGILFAGLFLAYGWLRTGQLWLSIGLHIGWNFFEGTIFGFPVSGLNTFRLIEHTVTGPTLITGGAFGPEAGLILLPAMALGVLIIHLYSVYMRQNS